jgi:hypothetical protein
MAYPAYIREKARSLRTEKHLSIDEIAGRLALPKTTIYYWVKDLPLGRPRSTAGQRKGTRNMQTRFAIQRAAAYVCGRIEFEELLAERTFRDFVCMYLAEGYKRSRNTVAVANSDARIIAMCARWMRHFSRNPVTYAVQYHADQDLDELRGFWSRVLGLEAEAIQLQRKSNSGRLSGRAWRSRHGVLTVRACDTLFRARLQGWMDCLQEQWLDSLADGA